jgi:hypothetical protein
MASMTRSISHTRAFNFFKNTNYIKACLLKLIYRKSNSEKETTTGRTNERVEKKYRKRGRRK